MAARASDLNGEYWPVVATATLLRWSAPNSQVGIMSARLRVMCVRFHRGRASNLFRSDPKSGHSVVHVRSAALCHKQTYAGATAPRFVC